MRQALKKHLYYYLDEYTFRFNRRKSKTRGLPFYRLLQNAVLIGAAPYHQLTARERERSEYPLSLILTPVKNGKITMKHYQYTIKAHHDFEFVFSRPRKITYHVVLPDGPITGLVVFIPGFGDDAGTYRAKFQRHIAETYSLACLSIDYHCYYSRPANGARLVIDAPVEYLLRSLTGCGNDVTLDQVIAQANSLKADPSVPLQIPGTLLPQHDEYQNFGILPALDNLYAMQDVLKRFPGLPRKIISIGSSYGGYIANLMTKFAPCTLNAVFDNSSWARPNLSYLVGHETGQTEFIVNLSQDIHIHANTKSPWSNYPFMPNSLHEGALKMRCFPEEHLDVMIKTGRGKTIYRFVHAENDSIADTNEKISLARLMMEKQFNVQMEVYSTEDIDGAYIKNTEHGMGLSLQKFFSICFEHVCSEIHDDGRTDFDFNHSIVFDCDTHFYHVSYENNAPPVCRVSGKNS